MRLSVGAGGRKKPGYVTVDIQPGNDVQAPMWDLPYQDGEIEAIYSRHAIEHVTFVEAQRTLREWHRVLQPGGTIEIICPNRDYHVWQLSQPGQSPAGSVSNWTHAMASLYGWQKHEHDFHKWAWTPEELIVACREAGFRDLAHSDAVKWDCHITGAK